MKIKIIGFVLRIIYRIQEWLTDTYRHPKCPYCGAACSEETDEVVYDGDSDEMECDECGKEYFRYSHFEINFSTEKVEQ